MIRVIPCVGAIVRDADDRLLVIRRGHEPAVGSWSLPGGRVEPGESARAAVVREVAEETGLVVAVHELIGTIHVSAGAGVQYRVDDYAATVTGGALQAGDDAIDARWVTPAELELLPTSPGLIAVLTNWGVLTPTGEG